MKGIYNHIFYRLLLKHKRKSKVKNVLDWEVENGINETKDLPAIISSQMAKLALNSSCITFRVDWVTLKVEFCWGYAGVMIGIMWNLKQNTINRSISA